MSMRYILLLLVSTIHLPTFAQVPTLADPSAPLLVEESLIAPPPETIVYDPVVVPAAQPCLPIHVVRDHYSFSAKRMVRSYGPPIHQTLCVENPANGCLYAVHVCVPQCCVGPAVCCGKRVGLLGRSYVLYQWPCGYKVEVVFRKHGGVILNYK